MARETRESLHAETLGRIGRPFPDPLEWLGNLTNFVTLQVCAYTQQTHTRKAYTETPVQEQLQLKNLHRESVYSGWEVRFYRTHKRMH